MTPLKIGIIGLDTSHVIHFTKMLNDETHPYYVPGGKVTTAYPGGSPDFELSWSRVEGYTAELRDEQGVAIVDSPEAVAEAVDAILLESADGRVHLEQFRRIARYGKPVFIDKPLAVTSADAAEIIRLAKDNGIPVMTSSALRFAEGVQLALSDTGNGAIIGADCFGPTDYQETQPGFLWYGIHSIEMLFTLMGPGCAQLTVASNEGHDLITGVWKDGRIGVVRGNRKGNYAFGASLHRESGTSFIDVGAHAKPFYASLMENVIRFFQTGDAPVSIEQSLEIIRFIEAANESSKTGKTIELS